MSHPPLSTAQNLSPHRNIRHGFFGRQGGVSQGLYDSLNLGLGSEDDPRDIRENRARVQETMQATDLLTCFQVHSSDVVTVTEPWTTRPKADAMVTRVSGLALCILTADCVPILFADPEAGIIGAAHAGWKGALSGIAESTVAAMQELGAEPARICAAIGPAIQQNSYEVGPEFYQQWVGAKPWSEGYFEVGTGDRLHFDLTGCVAHSLRESGLGSVETIAHDTCALDTQYFSNRRRTHQNQADYGRNGSVIVLA